MKKNRFLDDINCPSDIKSLSDKNMLVLAREIRRFLVEKVSHTGGHLSSNLGIVELTLAIHYVFDIPHDHLIWDVGHQSYVHKILTGRREMFDELRQPGGLSGFTKRSESKYDCFGAGHSSTSLSAALGFCEGDRLKGSDAYTIAVIGDGAFTGGMIHEALNNCKKNQKLIIIINENEMSISRNIGSFARYFAKIRSTRGYFRFKEKTVDIIKKIPLIGDFLFRGIRTVKQFFKNILYHSNYFEELGLYYLGPVDGNDYIRTKELLREARNINQSTIIQVKTQKGKGYKPAEQYPDEYHGVSPESTESPKETFSSVFGEYLSVLADTNPRICAVTAAMSTGTGLDVFREKHSERFFDVGIAEEHAMTFSAGLAADGMRPVFAVYSSFLQRAYDNLLHDVVLQRLPVVVCIDRAGLNSGDGVTHHGIYDVAMMSHIPDIEIYTPPTYETLKLSLKQALMSEKTSAIRYSSGTESQDIIKEFYEGHDKKDKISLRCNYDTPPAYLIITYGRIVEEALLAQKMLNSEGTECGVILLEKLKPYDTTTNQIISAISEKTKNIVFLEEGVQAGGAGECIYEEISRIGGLKNRTFSICAVNNSIAEGVYGKTYRQVCGITADDIVRILKNQDVT